MKPYEKKGKNDLNKSTSAANEKLKSADAQLKDTIQRDFPQKGVLIQSADEASEYAASIINTIHEPLIALDQNLRVVSASRSFYDVFKVKPEETVGQLIYNLGNKQWDIPKLRELLESILPQKTTFDDYEVEHNFATIGRRIMLLNARRIERGMGKERIILLAIEDITERKRLQEESEASEKHYRSAFETSADGLLLVDRFKGDILNSNPYAQVLLGYSKEEFLKNKLWEIGVVKDDKDFQEALSRLERDGVIYYDNISVINKAGLVVNTEVILIDKVKFIQCNIRDNTERRRAEEALKKSEEKYRNIFENVQDVYYETLFDGTILEVSPSVEIISKGHYKRADLIGKSMYEFYADIKDRDMLVKAIQKRGSVSDFEVPLKNRDGSSIPCSISAKLSFDAKGQPDKIVGTMYDITERKRAEEALSESEDKFRYVFDYSVVGKSITLPNGKVHVNKAFCEILGYSPEELQNKRWQDITYPDDIEVTQREMNFLISGEKEWVRFNKRYLQKNGSIVWIDVSSSLRRDKQGNPLYFVTTLVDINERKRADDELKKSEEKYRNIFENVQDVYYETLFDGTILEVSPSIEIMSEGQYKRADLIGRSIYELYPDVKDRDTILEAMKNKDDVSDFEILLKNRDGSFIPCSISSKMIFNAEGQPKKIIGSLHNISERKRVEEALRESELRFRSLYENTTIGLYRTTPDGNILLANPALITMLGYTSFQKLAERNLEKEDFELSSQRKEFLEKIEREGEVRGYDSKWIRQDGKVIFVLESARAIRDFQGKTLYYDGTVEDMTERRKMEEGLRQVQKLEGLGTLAGGIAHDFNNILGIILAFVTSIKRFKDDTKKLDLAVDTIVKAVERGKTLVQQILTFARKTETSFGAVNVNDVVIEIMTMILETFPKTLTYSQNFDKAIPFINADRSQLYQVLLNLCVNARDAMPIGGVLTINTRMVSVARLRTQHPDATASSYVCIEVIDTGEGMTEEIRKRIFEPFFTTKGIGKGTGLGLSVVFGVVQTHKGFIDVTSKLGKGTTFRLYLPVSQVVEPIIEKEEETLEEIPGGTETLLVIEDEEMLLMSLQMVLIEKGYNVLSAGDGLTALKIYQEKKNDIALVLTDLGLPNMTGLEVCQRIKAIKPNEHFILATGYLDPEMKSEFLKAGIEHFLYKPYNLTKVLKEIREVLDKK